MSSSAPSPGGFELTTNRIEAFSDGIFAIVITLMAFEIKVPQIAYDRVAQDLPGALLALLPRFLSVVLSFVVVGIYWVAHHHVYHQIRRTNRQLLWLNILFLLPVTFLPFSAATLGAYAQHQIAILVYGVNLIAIHAKRLMHAAEVVIHEVEAHHRRVVLGLLL